jgi:uncharacterized protein (TIGR02231 family)
MKNMKKLFLGFIILPILVYAQKPVQSEITNVTVYQNGAKITNQASVSLKAGTNEIVIRNVPANIDQNSLQAQLLGDVMLLSATSRNTNLEDADLPKKTKVLSDSLEMLNNQITWMNSEKTVYTGELQVITANQLLSGKEEKVSVDEIMKLADFYRTRVTDIKKKIFKIETDVAILNKLLARLQEKLQELSYSERKTIGEVVLTVSANKTTTAKLRLSYLTYQAAWTPIYDIRAGKADGPVTLVYKANVAQNTGLNWEKVSLTISTGNPQANNNRPILYPWYINFYNPIVYQQRDLKKSVAPMQNMLQRSMAASEVMADEEMRFDDVPSVSYDVGVENNRISAQYEIEVPQNIPSDNKVHLVAMKEYQLTSKFMYHAIPKLDAGTFLIAKVADYGKYNLLAGQANLFFEGMYIGQSYLNPVTTVDSMLLSLGRDEKIVVKRNQLTDLTNRQTIGVNTKETKAYEISVRNNNTFKIELDLMDQVPIAQNKDIEVKVDEVGGAKYDATYGSLLWKLNLKPGETKKVKFIYTVKYPKEKQIQGL